MGRDDQGTLQRLKQHRAVTDPIGARHGGRIVGSAGDGLLVEFPSVVEAVNYAVEIQTVIRMTAPGYKRKSQHAGLTSALTPIADIPVAMSAFRRFTSAYPPTRDILATVDDFRS